MRIVIAIDKFKGSASSMQLAQCIEHTLVSLIPNANIITVPIADGGDGTMLAIKDILGNEAVLRKVTAHRPILNLKPVTAQYLLDETNHTAYMDLATTSGLTLVPTESRDIMSASTFGTGEMITDALKHGAKHIVMGLGGSATCDGAMGLLAALGYEFLDAERHILPPCGDNLRHIAHIDTSGIDNRLNNTRFTLLTDVDNPLTGPRGAAAIFAPQKGATPEQVDLLEQGLKNFARFMPESIVTSHGAGAAGGVAAGMSAFLGANITPGIDYLLQMARFEDIIADADLIITGEGRIDEQTAMGKAPAGVLKAAKRLNIPVIALCGSLAPGIDTAGMGFSKIVEVTPHDMPLEQAMDTTTTLTNVANAIRTLISTLS